MGGGAHPCNWEPFGPCRVFSAAPAGSTQDCCRLVLEPTEHGKSNGLSCLHIEATSEIEAHGLMLALHAACQVRKRAYT